MHGLEKGHSHNKIIFYIHTHHVQVTVGPGLFWVSHKCFRLPGRQREPYLCREKMGDATWSRNDTVCWSIHTCGLLEGRAGELERSGL